MVSAVSSTEDYLNNSPIDSSDILVRIWCFNPNGITANWSEHLFKRNAPYLSKTPAIGFKPTRSTETRFVKVSNSSNITSGGFLAKASDIQGLTPAQIQSKFALPNPPTYDSDTHSAASQMTSLLSGQKFDSASYRVIFQASTSDLRTPEWLLNLWEYSRQHLTVQLSLAGQVQGNIEVGIKQGGVNGGTGRADVLKDYGTYSRIWEIKPYRPQYLVIGNTQLQRYVDKANSVSGQSFSTPIYRGLAFNDYYIDYNATSVLKVYGNSGVAGLVQYEIQPKTEGLQYELVPVTVPEYDYQFDATRLQIVIGGVLVVGAIAGLIYVTVQSSGAAAPVTVPLIYKLLLG